MKWIHISDLHLNVIDEGSSTQHMRNRLLSYLKELDRTVDVILITGDFRYAPKQSDSDDVAQSIVNFILDIAEALGVNNRDNIYLVPGNHDLDRNYKHRKYIINGVLASYNPEDGYFDSDDLEAAIDGVTFFERILRLLYGKSKSDLIRSEMKDNPHRVACAHNCNLLLLNSALFCGRDKEEGSIIVGNKYVLNALTKINGLSPNEPTIVIAHHGLRILNTIERRLLLNYFRDYNVSLYLCGHEHELWYEPVTSNTYQINMGCLKCDGGMQAGFSLGSLESSTNSFIIESHVWDNQFSKWGKFPQFGQKNGIFTFNARPHGITDVTTFTNLFSMFTDVEKHILERADRAKDKTVFGFGMDMQVALPWLEKFPHTVPNLTFKMLVIAPESAYLQESDGSNYDKETLSQSLSRYVKLQALTKNIYVKKSSAPYFFHGLIFDDVIYFTLLSNSDGVLTTNPPFLKMNRSSHGTAKTIFSSFESWFSFFWGCSENVLEDSSI